MSVNMYGNLGGFSYISPDINLFDMAKTQNNEPVRFCDTEAGRDMPAIKVSISQEGLRALHGTKLPGSVDIKAEQEKLKYYSEHQPIEPFRNRLSVIMHEGIEKLRQNDPARNISYSEKENILITGFRNIVDEISNGYEDGTRLRFIHDDSSEDGYKKLTKEEELSILQQEFDSFVNDRFGKKTQMENEAVAKAINHLQDVKRQNGMANVRYYQPEKIPSDFVDRLMKSSRRYILERI